MGTHFYWMCDCKPVSEVLEYDVNIAMLCWLAQELLGYHFSVLHRPARIIIDVDALTRWFDNLIAYYVQIAVLLS